MRPSRPRRRRGALLVLCAAAIAAAPALAAAQSPITNADVPGAADFSPGARTLVLEEWKKPRNGFLPPTIAVVDGSMHIVQERGRSFLRVTDGGSFDLILPGLLPEEYTIEFDMLVPSGTGYAVEVRPATPGEPAGYAGLSRRARNPVVNCGVIGSGVYGASLDATRRFDDELAKALVPCQIAVSPQGVRVFFAGEDAAAVPDVSLGRAPRIRFHVPAMAGQEALIGPIRVATSGSLPTVASGGPGRVPGGTALPTAPAPTPVIDDAPPAEPTAVAGIVPQSDPTPAPTGTVTRSGEMPTIAGTVPASGVTPTATTTVTASGTKPTASGTVVPSSGTPMPMTSGSGTATSGTGPAGRQTVGKAGPVTVTRTPQAVAASMRAQQKTASQAAAALVQEFHSTLAEVTAALAAGGYSSTDIAAWLKKDHSATIESAMILMHETGVLTSKLVIEGVWAAFGVGAPALYGSDGARFVKAAREKLDAAAADVLAAIAKQQPRSSRDWAMLFGQGGYAAHETAEALRIVLSQNEEGVAAALRGQVSLEDLALALASSFNTDGELFAELMQKVVPGLPLPPPAAVATALTNAFKMAEPVAIATMRGAGYGTESIVRALKEAYGRPPADIVAQLRIDVPAEDLVKAIVTVFPQANEVLLTQAFKAAGATADQFAPALRVALGLDENALAKGLITGGFDATTVAGAMIAAFNGIKPETVATALAAAGIPPGPIATALVEAFALAANNVAALLASLGIQ